MDQVADGQDWMDSCLMSSVSTTRRKKSLEVSNHDELLHIATYHPVVLLFCVTRYALKVENATPFSTRAHSNMEPFRTKSHSNKILGA